MAWLIWLLRTPSISARSRSSSTNTCGVLAENGEYTPVMPGVALAAATSSAVALASASLPSPARSCRRREKPPVLPSPCTGGGVATITEAPLTALSRSRRSTAILSAVSPCSLRWDQGSNTGARPAEFDELVPVTIEKPEKVGTRSTPGTCRAIASIC
ncbi:hypothetical protein D9M73_230320 [compost metagenome]